MLTDTRIRCLVLSSTAYTSASHPLIPPAETNMPSSTSFDAKLDMERPYVSGLLHLREALRVMLEDVGSGEQPMHGSYARTCA